MKNRVYIIAEIGFNHNGSIKLAKQMIKSAKENGANAVKFQSFNASDLYIKNKGAYDILKKVELTKDDHVTLKTYCDELNIDFLSTPFSFEWVDFLDSIEVPAFKIASMDLNFYPFIEKVISKNKPIYLSTGLATLEEIKKVSNFIKNKHKSDLYLLHCISNYPTKPEDVNLYDMITIRETTNTMIGFSDHTLGINISLAAVSLGAFVIEKHFTIDKNLEGLDQKISINPVELSNLRIASDEICKSMNKSSNNIDTKRPDFQARKSTRRGIYASSNIKKGEIITIEKLKFVRPEITSVSEINNILEKEASNNILQDEAILMSDIKK